MSEKNRGIVMAVSGLLVLALSVIDAVDRGASAFRKSGSVPERKTGSVPERKSGAPPAPS